MLGERLQAIGKMVPSGRVMADIGSDHARLPLHLVAKGQVPRAIASEWGEGPYRRAVTAVKNSPFSKAIEVRQGNGLQVLAPGEVETVVIAGMGGDTVADILAREREKAATFRHYILQPMTRPAVLRGLLAEWGWPVLDEQLVREKTHIYTIIHACPGDSPYRLSPLEQDLGVLLLKNSEEINRSYLSYYLERYKGIYGDLCRSGRQECQGRQEEFRNKIIQLEDLLGES